MLYDNFGKYQIDLENQTDLNILKGMLSQGNLDVIKEEDVAIEKHDSNKASNIVFPSALQNEVIVEEHHNEAPKQRMMNLA